jgi:uncharacterized lipoprotein YddW (UPF0748 family)
VTRRQHFRPAPVAWWAPVLLSGVLAACTSAAVVGLSTSPAANSSATRLAGVDAPPAPAREFRAAWVATVANIDWPSAPGLSAATQRAEALQLLDRARALGLNALVLQVRPAGDALYPSTLEPWSEVLSGAQGKAPWLAGEAPWDPLAFWVEEAHKRGLELHAWFNPYRARHSSSKSPLVLPHIGLRQPQAVKAYGDQLWMDPGEPAAVAQTLAVVADVVRRYDIDGVHIDDYFYPYPLPLPTTTAQPGAPAGAVPTTPATAPQTTPAPNPVANAAAAALAAPAPAPAELPFPDDEAYAAYRLKGGPLARDDWRRANVDSMVQTLNRTVHDTKAWVRFGVSPFGVGKPELRPPGVIGFSQYDKLYADAERWLKNGWMDYLAPQLYWQINREGLQFPVLLDYWIAQNTAQRHIWPGLYTSQIKVPANPAWPARELIEQVQVQRSRPQSTGHIHFSMVALMQDREGIATLLQLGPYAQAALVPATPWLDNSSATPAPPQLRRVGNKVNITPANSETVVRWAVWRRSVPSSGSSSGPGANSPVTAANTGPGTGPNANNPWRLSVQGPQERSVDSRGADVVAVSAINRVGVMSAPALLATPASP